MALKAFAQKRHISYIAHVSLSKNKSLTNVIEESKSISGEAASIMVNKIIYIYVQCTINSWPSYICTVKL